MFTVRQGTIVPHPAGEDYLYTRPSFTCTVKVIGTGFTIRLSNLLRKNVNIAPDFTIKAVGTPRVP